MSAPSSAQASAALTDLLLACADGERGFHAAAQRIEDPTLRQLCETYAQQRAAFRLELLDELAELGECFGGPGGLGWGTPKPASDSQRVVTLADLAERDVEMESTYQRALDRGLPGQASETVERQHRQLSDAAKHLSLVQQVWPQRA
jgi:hypothetical protein